MPKLFHIAISLRLQETHILLSMLLNYQRNAYFQCMDYSFILLFKDYIKLYSVYLVFKVSPNIKIVLHLQMCSISLGTKESTKYRLL